MGGGGREGLAGMQGIFGRLPRKIERQGGGGPEIIVSPTKRDRFMWGVEIRVMEWICEDWSRYRVGTPAYSITFVLGGGAPVFGWDKVTIRESPHERTED